MASRQLPHADHPLSVTVSAPHRIFFLGGAIQLVLALLVWLCILGGRFLPLWAPPTMAVAGMPLHIFLMLYGLFTFFVFGFISTVFPRWLSANIIPKGRYVTIVGILALGMLCFYIGAFACRELAIAGTIIFAAGWLCGLITLLQVWRSSEHPSKRYALFPFACITGGWLGCCSYAAWLITGNGTLFTAASTLGLWLYLLPLIVGISYRMLPFFSSRVLTNYTIVKPGWTLPATLACVLIHFVLTISGHVQWVVLADLPLACMTAWHSYRWQLLRSLKVPLLGMLHVSFAWLTIALLLYSAQSLLRLSGASFDLGLAPLHALGIGYITGMLVGMASRVSLGHSGRPLVADGVTRWAFAVIQAAAVIRILAEFPPFRHHAWGNWLVLIAGLVWLIAFVPWSVRFGLIYVTPRVDGRPG